MPIGRKTLSDEWKKKIKTSMLVNRLQDLAECTDGSVKMSKEQIKAAEILLKKVAPDLKSVEHKGDAENPVKTDVTLQALQFLSNEQLQAILALQMPALSAPADPDVSREAESVDAETQQLDASAQQLDTIGSQNDAAGPENNG